MVDLFEESSQEHLKKRAPLADRMRPTSLDDYLGQQHIIGEDRILRKAIEADEIGSIILWGPPGTGKTTLARIIANTTGALFVFFSAVTSGVKEVRSICAQAKNDIALHGKHTILFVDEIHRFNKAQQDAFLPFVENGTITLIGATTENPSFEVIAALLSRSRVFTLKHIPTKDLEILVRRTIQNTERGLGNEVLSISDKVITLFAEYAHGDARSCLNALEFAVMTCQPDAEGVRHITPELVMDAMQQSPLTYDKGGEEHYNIISAFQKSIRGSDPDAALYWMVRMLEGGEDPMYILRRMVRIASEDIGNADPQALAITIAAKEAFHFLGKPEGDLAMGQAVVYLATAPKSNAIEVALDAIKAVVRKTQNLPVPLHIRNAPTKLMKDMEYGTGYLYDHDATDAYSGQEHLPEALIGNTFYHPKAYGFERDIKKRMMWWAKKKSAIDDKKK